MGGFWFYFSKSVQCLRILRWEFVLEPQFHGQRKPQWYRPMLAHWLPESRVTTYIDEIGESCERSYGSREHYVNMLRI